MNKSIQFLAKEVGQLEGGVETKLGSPDWVEFTCSQCKSELEYYTSRFYEPPYVALKCPICQADLGIIGSSWGKVRVVSAKPWPPLVYTCPYCGATFDTQSELDTHIASQHPAPVPVGWLDKVKTFAKEHWMGLTAGGLGVVVVGIAIAKAKKR